MSKEITKNIMGVRDTNKVASLFNSIEEYEKTAINLLMKTAHAYYDAGNILTTALKKADCRIIKNTKAFAEATGFPEKRITLALKIFKHFENNPDVLKGLSMREALKLIAPPHTPGEVGYNRVDLGSDSGQTEFDFGELFNLPPTANRSLRNYRTVGDLINEIIIVRRTDDDQLTSKRFVRFFEDVPQNPVLRSAFKTMSHKTQAAIEDYLAAVEQEEKQ